MIKKIFAMILMMLPLQDAQQSNNLNCFTLTDVQTNGYTYLNDNVYDITGYNHPGGANKLNQARGQSLTSFFNSYKVHLNNNHVDRDLSGILIGKLSNSCIPPPPITQPPVTQPPVTQPPVTQVPTTQLRTTQTMTTRITPKTYPIPNKSNTIMPTIKLQLITICIIIFFLN
jgi:hypothetical protein